MAVIVHAIEKAISKIFKIFEIIVRIVEEIVDFLLSILGIEDQEIEYYDVKNVRMMESETTTNSLANTVIESILQDTDIAENLNYYAMHRSMRTYMTSFMNYIEDGSYFDGFPSIESYITYADTEEITTAIEIWRGKPCTLVSANVTGLNYYDWVRYWLQENKNYDYGENRLGDEEVITLDTMTVPAATNSWSSVNNIINVTITDAVGIGETLIGNTQWFVDVEATEYNETTDDYTVYLYNGEGSTATLPETVPSKPTELHYIAIFYENSDPDRLYMFVYKAGTGTYPDLDNPVNTINIESEELRALPAIPLRLRNQNYTEFEESKKESIEGLLDKLSLDAEDIIQEVVSGSGCSDDELDHVFFTFGIPMWDTTQPGMGYLFNLFRNIYPAQAVNQGAYNTETGDKSYNNIVIKCTDYNYGFQFAYITYEHFTLAEINEDPDSFENGIYYSDLSRFNEDLELQYPYYSSSGKGTYNVGYLADTIEEVQDYLEGNGIRNPQGWSDEAESWLQVTTRLKYGDTYTLLDADGNEADTSYITPDMCYRNNNGTLQMVSSASEETTSGQSITYYYISEIGMDAYTIVAPMAAMTVIDAGSGRSGVIKFNLGNKEDLLVPIVYNFVEVLPTHQIAQIVFNSAHCSLYIAYYEYIEVSFWMKLLGLVMIAIIVIVTILSWGTLTAPMSTVLFLGYSMLAYQAIILTAVICFAVGQAVKYAVVQLAKSNPTLAIIFAVFAAAAMATFSFGTGTFALSNVTLLSAAGAVLASMSALNTVQSILIQQDYSDFAGEQEVFEKLLEDGNNLLEEANELLGKHADGSVLSLLDAEWASSITPMLADDYYLLKDYAVEAQYIQYEPTDTYELAVASSVFFA